jgi:hypothetical protein
MAGAYADWRGHVIVCGLRGVGLRIVEQLSLSWVPAVVIDDDPDARLARTLVSWGVPHIAGSSRTAETLAEAGLAGATAVVCAVALTPGPGRARLPGPGGRRGEVRGGGFRNRADPAGNRGGRTARRARPCARAADAGAAEAAQAASAADELVISPWALYELTEAAVRSDQRERAVAAADQLSEIAAASASDWACGAAARSRELLAEGRAAEEEYREAIERLSRTRDWLWQDRRPGHPARVCTGARCRFPAHRGCQDQSIGAPTGADAVTTSAPTNARGWRRGSSM